MKLFLVNLLMFSLFDLSNSLCTPGGFNNVQPQFGPGCMYRCHCVGDVQCDSVTGECPGECAAAWMGPGCQYDIAYNKQVRQLLNGSIAVIDGRNAVDGLSATCVGPTAWVEVDLNATYRISGLVIKFYKSVSLQGLEITVGNASFDTSSDFARTCFKQGIAEQIGITSKVVCTTDIIGRYLLIKAPDDSTRMNLCDVRVYGGRSLAYRRDVAQSTTYPSACCGPAVASRALDGNPNTTFQSGTCTHTAFENSPWWRVNLALIYNVERIVLYSRKDCCVEMLSRFSVSFATNNTFSLVFKHPMETPMETTEITTLSQDLAQHVKISLKNVAEALPLTLCEDCQDNMCGWTCDTYCYCDGPLDKQNKIHANCPGGCKTGWWGYSCNNTRDANCKGNTCNESDGYCFECSLGKWRHICENDCTNCLIGTGCGTSNGICAVGCSAGLYGVKCNEHCGHCAGDGSCNRYTGACSYGCQPGWQRENCIIGRYEDRYHWKRATETSQIESTYDQIDTTRVQYDISSEYSKIEKLDLSSEYAKGDELDLSSVTRKESTYENILSADYLLPISEFRDIYQNYVSMDDKTGELRLFSIFKSIGDPDLTKATVTRLRDNDYMEKVEKTYFFEDMGNKESTILSDVPTTSEALWRIALERRINLIIIIGENRIQFKPNVQVEIGLILIECVDMTVERDLLLCNLTVTGSEKEAKVINVQVLLCDEESSLCIPSDINKTGVLLRKRLRLRVGMEVFNTLINCTPEAKEGECFVASLLMTDFLERSGRIDICGIIEAMRKEKHDAIDTFDRFKFCHDVIFKWIENK